MLNTRFWFWSTRVNSENVTTSGLQDTLRINSKRSPRSSIEPKAKQMSSSMGIALKKSYFRKEGVSKIYLYMIFSTQFMLWEVKSWEIIFLILILIIIIFISLVADLSEWERGAFVKKKKNHIFKIFTDKFKWQEWVSLPKKIPYHIQLCS